MKKKQTSAADLLRNARDWFKTHEPVKDWQHVFETLGGESLDWQSQPPKVRCRACILGALEIASRNASLDVKYNADIYLAQAKIRLFPFRNFTQRFTKREIRKVFNAAIQSAERPL